MEDRLKILLVEDEQAICKRFISLSEEYDGLVIVASTGDSAKALECVRDYWPDVIILDLELHYGSGNGLSLLKELKETELSVRPYILVTTNNSSPVTYEYARKMGADFIMSKHQQDYSEQGVLDFIKMMRPAIENTRVSEGSACGSPTPATDESPEQHIRRITRRIMTELDYVGISPKAVGYKYLADAIRIVIEKPTQNLCTVIGKLYGKTDCSVERAMQNAIDKAWKTSDIDVLLKSYTARISSSKGVPTITEFVYYYANKIKNEY